jgi:hypothetical protein
MRSLLFLSEGGNNRHYSDTGGRIMDQKVFQKKSILALILVVLDTMGASAISTKIGIDSERKEKSCNAEK